MKTMAELNQLLSQQEPLDPLVKILNNTFGPLGWDYDGSKLKVIAQVSEGQFLHVSRFGTELHEAAALFGLGVKNEKKVDAQHSESRSAVASPQTPRQASEGAHSANVGITQNRMEGVRGESKEALPPSPVKPNRKVIDESITVASQILINKKIKTQDELVALLQSYGVKSKSALGDEKAAELLGKLEDMLK